jgi:hypothetical protein
MEELEFQHAGQERQVVLHPVVHLGVHPLSQFGAGAFTGEEAIPALGAVEFAARSCGVAQ